MKLFSALFLCLLSIQIVAQEPKPPQSYLDGLEALKNSDYKNATALFQQAIAEKPDLIEAYYALKRVHVVQREYGAALDLFDRLLKLNPLSLDTLYVHYEMGKMHILLEDYSGGIEECRWLIVEESKGSAQPHLSLAPRIVSAEKPVIEMTVKTDPETYSKTPLAQYLLDLIPPEIAEANGLPPTKIIYAESAKVAYGLATPASSIPSQPNTSGTAHPVPKEQGSQVMVTRTSPVEQMTANLRPKILYQEKAKYTEIARQNSVQGTVMLSVVFDASGLLSEVRVVRGLLDGLTQNAIRAAQKIRFTPANRDGAPVSVRGTLEYSFNLY